MTNPEFVKYVLPKGFVAVDGCSLTVGATGRRRAFCSLHCLPMDRVERLESAGRMNNCALRIQVGEVGEDWFSVYLIPETIRLSCAPLIMRIVLVWA